jgi:FkbM family methyltransferase
VRTRLYRLLVGAPRAAYLHLPRVPRTLLRPLFRVLLKRPLATAAARVRPRIVTVNGMQIETDTDDTLHLAEVGIYEPLLTARLGKLLREGDTFVDVGANIGYFTLLAARTVGPRGRVVAFEPEPTNFEILERNVERNGFTNVTLERRAVSDRSGPATIYTNPINLGAHTLYPFSYHAAEIPIEATSLDDYLEGAELERLVLKLDIEGAEGRVVHGAANVLARTPDCVLVTEFLPSALRAAGTPPEELMQTLRATFTRIEVLDEESGNARDVSDADPATLPEVGSYGLATLVCSSTRTAAAT